MKVVQEFKLSKVKASLVASTVWGEGADQPKGVLVREALSQKDNDGLCKQTGKRLRVYSHIHLEFSDAVIQEDLIMTHGSNIALCETELANFIDEELGQFVKDNGQQIRILVSANADLQDDEAVYRFGSSVYIPTLNETAQLNVCLDEKIAGHFYPEQNMFWLDADDLNNELEPVEETPEPKRANSKKDNSCGVAITHYRDGYTFFSVPPKHFDLVVKEQDRVCEVRLGEHKITTISLRDSRHMNIIVPGSVNKTASQPDLTRAVGVGDQSNTNQPAKLNAINFCGVGLLSAERLQKLNFVGVQLNLNEVGQPTDTTSACHRLEMDFEHRLYLDGRELVMNGATQDVDIGSGRVKIFRTDNSEFEYIIHFLAPISLVSPINKEITIGRTSEQVINVNDLPPLLYKTEKGGWRNANSSLCSRHHLSILAEDSQFYLQVHSSTLLVYFSGGGEEFRISPIWQALSKTSRKKEMDRNSHFLLGGYIFGG